MPASPLLVPQANHTACQLQCVPVHCTTGDNTSGAWPSLLTFLHPAVHDPTLITGCAVTPFLCQGFKGFTRWRAGVGEVLGAAATQGPVAAWAAKGGAEGAEAARKLLARYRTAPLARS